ncbi:MAG: SpoIIE family protein phosphatase [Armatimonadota bacterium]
MNDQRIDREDKSRELDRLLLQLAEAKGHIRTVSADEPDGLGLAWLAAIVQSSDDAIIGKTLDGVIVSWNSGAQRIYGYSAEEVIGKPISILAPPDRPDEIPRILDEIKAGERVEHFETERITKDGNRIHVSLSVSPVVGLRGIIIGAATIARDITRLKNVEQVLREDERFISSTLNSLTTHIAIIDEDGIILYTNLPWRRFAEENACTMDAGMLGVNYLTICDNASGQDADIAQAAAAGIRDVAVGHSDSFTLEYPCHSPDYARWFRMRVTRFAGYGPVRIVVAHENITDAKVASEEKERLVRYLGARTRELNCLYQISSLGQTQELSLEDIVCEAARIMPDAWQYPEITGSRIVLECCEYRTDRFCETPWMQRTNIYLNSRVIGMVEVSYLEEKPAEQEGPFTDGERSLIDSIARSLGDILERKQTDIERENARRALEEVYARERRIAETLQRNFLPDRTPAIEGYRLADAYCAALDEAAIGGDVYDVFRLPNGDYCTVIADVSGKGLQAAKYGASVKYMLRAYSYQMDDPADVLRVMNNSVSLELDLDAFVTCFLGVLNPVTGEFKYANAGHDEPLHIPRKTGIPVRLSVTGSALGLVNEADYTSESFQFERGDMLFMYTDGVTDPRGIEERLGVEGLERYVADNCHLSAESLVRCVLAEVNRRSGDRLADDIAMLAVEVIG